MNNLLQFVKWSELGSWDVKQYINTLIKSNFPIEILKKCINEEKEKVKPFENANKDFKILGVNNKTGLFDNEIKKGKEINQAYKIVEDGFLAYNPYRINVGSIGLKTKQQNNDLISPAYVVFSCLKNTFPEYLFLIFKTDTFNQVIQDNTRGSVRQILAYDILERLKIPLPPLATQQQLVKNYQDKLNLAEQQEQQAQDKEAEIERYLYQELGIEKEEEKQNDDLLQFVRFKDLESWSVDKQTLKIKEGIYKNSFLKKIIVSTQYGLSLKANYHDDTPLLRMNNIFNGSLLLNDIKYVNSALVHEKYILNIGDLLFNRTNSKELVGKTAVFKEQKKHAFASYLIRVCLNEDMSNQDYVSILINSRFVREQINIISRQITGQVNVNAHELKNLTIPLPPLEIQNKIANHIQGLKDEIQTLKQQAQENRALALTEFEAEIFDAP